jgi:hypothetical protein
MPGCWKPQELKERLGAGVGVPRRFCLRLWQFSYYRMLGDMNGYGGSPWKWRQCRGGGGGESCGEQPLWAKPRREARQRGQMGGMRESVRQNLLQTEESCKPVGSLHPLWNHWSLLSSWDEEMRPTDRRGLAHEVLFGYARAWITLENSRVAGKIFVTFDTDMPVEAIPPWFGTLRSVTPAWGMLQVVRWADGLPHWRHYLFMDTGAKVCVCVGAHVCLHAYVRACIHTHTHFTSN